MNETGMLGKTGRPPWTSRLRICLEETATGEEGIMTIAESTMILGEGARRIDVVTRNVESAKEAATITDETIIRVAGEEARGMGRLPWTFRLLGDDEEDLVRAVLLHMDTMGQVVVVPHLWTFLPEVPAVHPFDATTVMEVLPEEETAMVDAALDVGEETEIVIMVATKIVGSRL